MTVRLRPHHLLCILTYIGRGYSPAFTANMTQIAERLTRGENVLVVDGPDDICAPLLEPQLAAKLMGPGPHCLGAGVVTRDRRAAAAVGKMLGLQIRAGARLVLDPQITILLRDGFAAGGIRAACAGCEWRRLCGEVAARGFTGAVLAPP